jgi:acyl-CoA thioester hydrolase
MLHLFETKIYVSDTDIGGVTYYSNYLKFIEHARSELYSDMGFNQMDMLNDLNIGFMVSQTSIEYKSPSTLNDKLIITTQVTDIGRTKLSTSHKIYKNSLDSKPITLVTATLVCVDAKLLRPKQMPEEIKDALINYITE